VVSVDQQAVDMVTAAHRNQLALRLEVSALEAAIAAGHTTVPGQYAYALTWLAEHAAQRLMLKDAAPAQAAATGRAPTPRPPQGAAGTPATHLGVA
jgi:hypothetical protein